MDIADLKARIEVITGEARAALAGAGSLDALRSVRSRFVGKTGSLDFLMERKGVFKIAKDNLNVEDLELELIDSGLEDIAIDDNEIYIYTAFNDFGAMSKALEEKGAPIISAEKQRIPNTFVELSETQQEEIIKLVESLEQDDDIQHVFHNMK